MESFLFSTIWLFGRKETLGVLKENPLSSRMLLPRRDSALQLGFPSSLPFGIFLSTSSCSSGRKWFFLDWPHVLFLLLLRQFLWLFLFLPSSFGRLG